VTHQAGHQSRVLPSFGVPQPGRHNWSLTGPGVRSGSRLCFTQPGSFASDAEARNDSLAETHQQCRYCERYCRAFRASVKCWPCLNFPDQPVQSITGPAPTRPWVLLNPQKARTGAFGYAITRLPIRNLSPRTVWKAVLISSSQTVIFG